MKRTTAILILTFVCLFNNAHSQTKTAYEKKVDQIMIEMCNAVGVDNSLLQSAIKLNDWDIVRTSQDFAFKCKMLDRNQLLVIFSVTEQKLKDADKLKTEEDLRKEIDRKEKERLNKERELQKELSMFSDLEIIKKEIQTEFRKWIKKDEFETVSQYNFKISNKSNKLDSIAYESVSKRIKSLNCEYSNNRFFVELKNYDSEKQIYPISLVHKVYYSGTFQNKIASIDDTLIIDIDLAKRIKENSIKGRLDWEGSNGFILEFCRGGRFFANEINNWATSKSGFFYPITYNLLKEFTHTSKVFETPIIKLTISTNELGLQEYFEQNQTISFEAITIKIMELKRNNLILQAESLLSENKFENALKLYREAYQIKQSEEIKSKISDIEMKIIEKKQNELIKIAESNESEGSATKSIEKLKKAKEIFLEVNSLKYSDTINIKIIETEGKIIEINQNELIKTAEKYENLGEIKNSIEKFQEANKLKIRIDIGTKIDLLVKGLDMALTNHKILDSLFTLAQLEKLKLFNDAFNLSALDDIKIGFGQKYLNCKTVIETQINSFWEVISNSYTEININRNREVWNAKSQELMQKILEFRNEVSKNSNFEINVQKALKDKDKKNLKIFKENDVNIIIESILKTN